MAQDVLIQIPKMTSTSLFKDPPSLGMDLSDFSHAALSLFTHSQLAQESLYFSLVIKPMQSSSLGLMAPEVRSVLAPILLAETGLSESSLKPLVIKTFRSTVVEPLMMGRMALAAKPIVRIGCDVASEVGVGAANFEAPSIAWSKQPVMYGPAMESAPVFKSPDIRTGHGPILTAPPALSLGGVKDPLVVVQRHAVASVPKMTSASLFKDPPSLGMDLSDFSHAALSLFTHSQLAQESTYFTLTIRPMRASGSGIIEPSVFTWKEAIIDCDLISAYCITYMPSVTSELIYAVADVMSASTEVNAPEVTATTGATIEAEPIAIRASLNPPTLETFRSTVVKMMGLGAAALVKDPDLTSQRNKVVVPGVGTSSVSFSAPTIAWSRQPVIYTPVLTISAQVKSVEVHTGYGPILAATSATSYGGAESPLAVTERHVAASVPKMTSTGLFIHPPTLGMDLSEFSHAALSLFTHSQLAQESLYFTLTIRPMQALSVFKELQVETSRQAIIKPDAMASVSALKPPLVIGFLKTSVTAETSQALASAYDVFVFYDTKATATIKTRKSEVMESVVPQKTTVGQRDSTCHVHQQTHLCSVSVFPALAYIKVAR